MMLKTAVLVSAAVATATACSRPACLPYPVPSNGFNATCIPGELLLVDDSHLTADQVLLIESAQGILSKECISFVRASTASNDQAFIWAQSMAELLDLKLHIFPITSNSDIQSLLNTFSSKWSGVSYIRCKSPSDKSGDINACLSMSACSGSLAVTSATEDVVKSFLPFKMDVTGLTTSEVVYNYYVPKKCSFSARISTLQDPSKDAFMGGFSISSQALTWYSNNMNDNLTATVLSHLDKLPFVFGWGPDEYETVKTISKSVAGTVHASDWCKNMAVYTNLQLPSLKQKNLDRSAAKATPVNKNVHTISFLMTDGDNVQWLLSGFNVSNWYSNANRGKVPIGWTISPALAELAPAAMHAIYEQGTPNDEFISAPSGIGYSYPDVMAADLRAQFNQQTVEIMQKADLRIVNVIADKYSDAAAGDLLKLDGIDAVFYYLYSSYVGLNGKIQFYNKKPMIGGRLQLWTGTFESVDSLVSKLLQLPRDSSNVDSYTLIPVHVWSNTVTDVVNVVNQLNQKAPGAFDVLLPSAFASQVAALAN